MSPSFLLKCEFSVPLIIDFQSALHSGDVNFSMFYSFRAQINNLDNDESQNV